MQILIGKYWVTMATSQLLSDILYMCHDNTLQLSEIRIIILLPYGTGLHGIVHNLLLVEMHELLLCCCYCLHEVPMHA